jgi:short subunit dehydrogenase-like uncharacterized protein
MSRKYDIILFGASGFTGQLVAAYLSLHASKENIRWAMAGRDEHKLNDVLASLPDSKPEIILADIKDDVSLQTMTAQGVLLMNAVGPFNWFGKSVVKACIASGTHYLDITGEPSFVADIYNNYFQSAIENQTTIVNCCGFDSIPADYAAWLTAMKLPKNEPKKLMGYIRTNATFSGGTLTTAVHALHMETKKSSVKTKIRKHPDAPKIALKVHYSKDVNAWVIPMPVVDPHIVKRSAFRLKDDFGEAISYGQFFVRSSFVKVVKTVVPILSAILLVRFKFFRQRLFDKFKPGTGPDAVRRSKTKFEAICVGTTTTATARTVFSGGDPGYNETAKMFSESAFTLLDKVKNNTIGYGVLTPVEAFGIELVHRLRREGIVIE